MPRKPRPGPRQNRTDLPAVASPGGPAQAPVSYTGGEYGSRQANVEAQRVAPMADRSADTMLAQAAASQNGAPAPAGDPATDPNSLAAFIASAQAAAPADEGGLLGAPTARPDEPITTGLPTGAGGGPEIVPPLAAAQGPDPSVLLWAPMLPALGVLAARPGSSPQVRQLYRRIRSQLPPDYYQQTET